MGRDLAGLKLDEAVALLQEAGIEPVIRYADVPFSGFDLTGRTPRVVRASGNELLVSHFRDRFPEA